MCFGMVLEKYLEELVVKEEYKKLIPRLSSEEYMSLREDISRNGIKIPLIVNKDGVIIDGYTRYEIAKELGLKKVPVKILDDCVDEKEMVICLNLHRRHLTLIQKLELGLKLYEIEKEKGLKRRMMNLRQYRKEEDLFDVENFPHREEKGRTRDIVAEKLGISGRMLQYVVKIKQYVEKDPEIKKGWQKVREGKESIYKLYKLVRKKEKRESMKKVSEEAILPREVRIIQGDFRERMREIEEASVDLVLTDPPYGKKYLDLWEDLSRESKRVLKPGGFLVTYCGQMYLPKVLSDMSKHLNYFWCISIQHTGTIKLLEWKNVKCCWKPVLVFYKEPLKKPPVFCDLIIGEKGDKDLHDWSQSIGEARKLIRVFSEIGDVVLDPFVGSGTTLIASLLEKRRGIGIDIDEDNIKITKARLYKVLFESDK